MIVKIHFPNLSSFRLPGARRTGWCSSQVHAKGLCESDVATIREWCYHQPLRTTEKLVLICEVNISNGDHTGVYLLIEISAGLFGPFEVVWGFYTLFDLSLLSR